MSTISTEDRIVDPGVTVIPRMFHVIWVGGAELDDDLRRYVETWSAHHPNWQLKFWDDTSIVPANFANVDLIQAANKPAQKADIMRYEILYRHGGVYVDCDFECLRPINSLLPGIQAFASNEIDDSSRYCSIGILGARPGHPVFARATSRIRHSKLNTAYVNHETGPYFFRSCFADGELTVFPTRYFYPIHYSDYPNPHADLSAAYGVHHWRSSWTAPVRRNPA